MSYLVLARKYRPRTFGEVTGQEVVMRTLQGAIAEERVGHAYLLHGPRGTGKTTTARIFAKALNCERGPASDPCNECERCRAADAGSEVDLVEIDAASHTGVGDVRLLREQAAYVPMRARYKVYLIDEVHMLSKPAFNALLKTLEEPPAHVKFLFATTELHKVPDTILSRCQVLKLAPLSEATIAARMREVFEREGVDAEEGVSELIARRARGGMRDALSLADQLLALVGDAPRLADVGRLASASDRESLQAILDAVQAGERRRVFELLPAGEGGENELLEALLALVRRSLVLASCGKDSPLVEDPPEAREWMVAFGKQLGADRLELWLEELLAARERMRELPSQARLTLELTLLALARPGTTIPLTELAERLLALESALSSGSVLVPERAPAARPKAAPEPRRAAPAAPRPPAGSSKPPASKAAPPRSVEPQAAPPARPVPETPAPAPAPAPRPSAAAAPAAPAASRPAAQPKAAPAPAPEAPPADTPSAAPAASSHPDRPTRRAGARSARTLRSSTTEAWRAFLESMAEASASLAEVLERCGRLVELANGRAVVRMENLREVDRSLVTDARNARRCSKVFTELMDESITVELVDVASLRPGRNDPFTQQVADLFGGRIED